MANDCVIRQSTMVHNESESSDVDAGSKDEAAALGRTSADNCAFASDIYWLSLSFAN